MPNAIRSSNHDKNSMDLRNSDELYYKETAWVTAATNMISGRE